MIRVLIIATITLLATAHRHRHHPHHNTLFGGAISADPFGRMPFKSVFGKASPFQQIDSIFNKIETEMNRDMKRMMNEPVFRINDKISLFEPLMTVEVEDKVEAPIATEDKIVEQTKKVDVIEVKGDKGKCFELLEQLTEKAIAVGEDIKNQEWIKLLPEVVELLKDTYEDYECFANMDKKELAGKLITKGKMMAGDRGQCVLDHLKKVIDGMRDAVAKLTKFDLDGATKILEQMVKDFVDIRNC